MKENLLPAMEHMLKHEGGFVNHPADPGGMTNLGVTQRVWENWLGHPVGEKEMRALTPAIVAPMYKKQYWDKVAGDRLPSGVDYIVFDAAVNSGPGRAAKWLQMVVNVSADGAIGPVTLKAVAAMPVDQLIEDYQAMRLEFLKNLSTWDTFGRGWGRRVAEVKEAALTFA